MNKLLRVELARDNMARLFFLFPSLAFILFLAPPSTGITSISHTLFHVFSQGPRVKGLVKGQLFNQNL